MMMVGDILVAVFPLVAVFDVTEAIALKGCVNGCLYVQERSTNLIECEGFRAGEEVAWKVAYYANNAYSGQCDAAGTCSLNPPGFSASVDQSRTVSVLAVDQSKVLYNLEYYSVSCSSGGQTAQCTLQYRACVATAPVNTPAPVPGTVKTTDSPESPRFILPNNPQGNVPVAAIAGGVGAFVFLVIAGCIVCYCVVCRGDGKKDKTSETDANASDQENSQSSQMNAANDVDVIQITSTENYYANNEDSKKASNKTYGDTQEPNRSDVMVDDDHVYVNYDPRPWTRAGNFGEVASPGETIEMDSTVQKGRKGSNGGDVASLGETAEMYAAVQKDRMARPQVSVKPFQETRGPASKSMTTSLAPATYARDSRSVHQQDPRNVLQQNPRNVHQQDSRNTYQQDSRNMHQQDPRNMHLQDPINMHQQDSHRGEQNNTLSFPDRQALPYRHENNRDVYDARGSGCMLQQDHRNAQYSGRDFRNVHQQDSRDSQHNDPTDVHQQGRRDNPYDTLDFRDVQHRNHRYTDQQDHRNMHQQDYGNVHQQEYRNMHQQDYGNMYQQDTGYERQQAYRNMHQQDPRNMHQQDYGDDHYNTLTFHGGCSLPNSHEEEHGDEVWTMMV